MTIHASTRRELLAGAGVLFAWPFLPKIARAEGRDPRMLTIVLRGALEYELPITEADARLSLELLAWLPAIGTERTQPWAVTALTIGAGF
jgi:uncharacterized protein (DUF1501 family)